VLKIFSLRNNSIEDKDGKVIARALKDNTILTKLYLKNTKIGCDSIKAIADAIRYNNVLLTPSLINNLAS